MFKEAQRGHQAKLWLSFISISYYISETILGGIDLWDEFVDAFAVSFVCIFFFFSFPLQKKNPTELCLVCLLQIQRTRAKTFTQ